MDLLERVHRLVEEERRVVHQHVDELDELLPRLGLVDHRELVHLERFRIIGLESVHIMYIIGLNSVMGDVTANPIMIQSLNFTPK